MSIHGLFLPDVSWVSEHALAFENGSSPNDDQILLTGSQKKRDPPSCRELTCSGLLKVLDEKVDEYKGTE